jgi:hypothetical protein
MTTYAVKLDAAMLKDLPHKVSLNYTEEAPRWVLEAWLQRNVKVTDWGSFAVNNDNTFYFKNADDATLFALKWIGYKGEASGMLE